MSKSYDGAHGPIVVVQNVNLELGPGEVCAIVGAAGAGKSTLLKLVCGLLVPSSGRITINNLDVERETADVQAGIGYLGAPFGLYDDMTAWEYLDYFGRAYGLSPAPAAARADSLLEQLRLSSWRDLLIERLPRGPKLLLGLARALVQDPPLLLLDEPTIGLDARERALFKRLVGELHAQGKTVLVASPTLTDVEAACDTVRLLEHGRLLAPDSAERLLQGAATTGEIV